MTRFITAIAAAATLIAAPAFASDPGKKSSDSMTKRVCVVRAPITGTMLTTKRCMTRGEWISQTGVDPLRK